MYKYGVVALLLAVSLLYGFVRHGAKRPYRFPVLTFFPALPGDAAGTTRGGVALGRMLFYDTILSRDSSIACASCHKQWAAFSDAPLAVSRGIDAHVQRRNTPPLFNMMWQPAFFWDGRAANITEQVFHPVRDAGEMGLMWTDVAARIAGNKTYRQMFRTVYGSRPIDSTLIADAIAQFERTLISYRSKYDRVLEGLDTFTRDEAEGFLLVNDMTKGNCLHCHTSDSDPLGTTFAYSNNGLDKVATAGGFRDAGRGAVSGNEHDNGKFRIPSIRNLAFTAPYMHDGRYSTLEQVVDFYSDSVQYSPTIDTKMGLVHRGGARLNADEKKKIVAFLLTMSDTAFVHDPEFGNPFVR